MRLRKLRDFNVVGRPSLRDDGEVTAKIVKYRTLLVDLSSI